MKTLLTLILVTATVLIANAQSPLQTILEGDTVELRVTGHHGDVQWQESTDSLIWTDMVGFTDSIAVFIATNSYPHRKYYRAIVTDASCPNETPVYSSIIRHKIVDDATDVDPGDWFRGGIFFYSDNGYDLIAPQTDQSTSVQWGCYGTNTPGITLSDGSANTTAIYNNCATRPIAASVCYDLELNGYNDWFLPAQDLLTHLYLYRVQVGGFSSNFYWSSSENSIYSARGKNFGTGSQLNVDKNLTNYVRCVRSASHNIALVTSDATVTNQPVTTTITTQPQTQNNCLGSSVTFSVATTGTAPISYQWKKGGADISGATSNTYTKSGLTLADEGIYTCEVTNLCRTIASNNAELKVIQLLANAGTDTRICNGQGTGLSASVSSNHQTESGNYSYSWSPSAGLSSTNIRNPNASPTVTTNYTVQTTDQLTCTATDVVNVWVQNVLQDEEICLVSVDTLTWKNKVMWEGTPNVGTLKYFIYKEVTTNVYNWVGEVLNGNPTYFIDNSSNPESHSDRYKITVIDTCNNESDKSPFHNTMNLVVSVFGNTMGLVWTPYETQDGSYTPDQYFIYKGTTLETMTLLTTVTGSQNTYNDVNVFDFQYYMIGAQRDCNTNPAYSNKRENGLVGIFNPNISGSIQISPNPMTSIATLTIPNFNSKTTEPLQIMDITGKIVKSITVSNVKFDNNKIEIIIEKGDLKMGVYFVELKADRTYRGKLVIE